MPRIPIEDNFIDVLGKAQRGLHLTDAELAAKAGIKPAELVALQKGEIRDHPLRAVARALQLNPAALLSLARREWYPEQPRFPRGFAIFNSPYDGELTVNSYLAWDSKTKLAVAFDTGTDVTAMLDTIAAERLTLRSIFITHTHGDHIAELPRLACETKAEVWASEREPVDFPGAKTFAENAHFHAGELAIKTLFTWGHSPGQTTFFVTGLSWPLAIVGDSLFAASVGGSTEHYAAQLKNNRDKIFRLPADTVLACGHGPLTTLVQERRYNPFFAR
ncbi:MAG: MBL fold metallo-hydrolase [Candidatus Didemnitutus sp.]|nr:MBL fold metallo-hydrolase [Candidatus Didemnitutus sp.]